jgi:hypothetical protein
LVHRDLRHQSQREYHLLDLSIALVAVASLYGGETGFSKQYKWIEE